MKQFRVSFYFHRNIKIKIIKTTEVAWTMLNVFIVEEYMDGLVEYLLISVRPIVSAAGV